jgi:hypothetical protein
MDTLPPVDDNVQYIPADAKRSPIHNVKLSQDLDIILTRLHASPHLSDKSSAIYENGSKGGVGMFPSADIKTTASLLVFNSSINPYKEYQALDNLASAGRFVLYICENCIDEVENASFRAKDTDDDAAKALASAPKTLMSGEGLPDIMALDLTFRPDIGVHEALDLPSNLPLDFLAGKQRTD